MKKWILRLALVFVVLLVVVLAVVFFSLNSIVKKGVETVGPPLTKTEVRLGSASLSPLSGSGRLSGLFIGNPEGYKTAAAITAGEVKVAVKVSSVFSDTVEIESVIIRAPEITLEGSLSGNNLSKILDNVEAATGGAKTTPPPKETEKKPSGPGKKFRVKDVVIEGGKIHLSVTALGGKALTVPLPELHLQNIGTGGEGVNAAELTREIIKPLLASVTKAATDAVANAGKGIIEGVGKGATKELDNATKGIKDLFKK